MARVNIHDAKTHLSRLIARAQRGEEIVIAKAGKPVAKLTAINQPKRRTFGIGRGTLKVVGEINDPLPDDVLNSFYDSALFPGEEPR